MPQERGPCSAEIGATGEYNAGHPAAPRGGSPECSVMVGVSTIPPMIITAGRGSRVRLACQSRQRRGRPAAEQPPTAIERRAGPPLELAAGRAGTVLSVPRPGLWNNA